MNNEIRETRRDGNFRMNTDALEMPKKKASSTRRGLFVAVAFLVALGVLAWQLVGDRARNLGDAARRQVSEMVDRVSPAEQAMPGENLSVSTVGQDAPSGRVSGTLTSVPPDQRGNVVQAPAGGVVIPPAPQNAAGLLVEPEPGPDLVDRALAESSSASSSLSPAQQAGLPTVSSALTRLAAPDDAGRQEDSVVTMDFFRDMARWLVDGYRPPARAGQRGRTMRSLISANMRYGAGLSGLRHAGGDPVRGRGAVLQYVYTPGMLDALYRLYVDRFMAEVARAALEARPGKKPLTDAQAADMLTVYAGAFRQVAAALRGVASVPDLDRSVQAVREAGQEVVRANSLFAETLYAYEEARDGGRAAEAERLRQKLRERSRVTERAVQSRNSARQALADAIRRGAGGRTPGEDSLVYLAEWVQRRGEGAPDATRMAANVLVRLADRFTAEAAAL
ncbi:MAG: hypothetical protein J1E80_04465 [Desulfovibrionaceae bacterium]|nr:hypothetical protein [Desulfovibrionaceae bacterium]